MIADGGGVGVDVERRRSASAAGSRMKATTSCTSCARKAPTNVNIAGSRLPHFSLSFDAQPSVCARVATANFPIEARRAER